MPRTYILRDLTDEQQKTFADAQTRAKSEGRGLKWVILWLLGQYAKGKVNPEA